MITLRKYLCFLFAFQFFFIAENANAQHRILFSSPKDPVLSGVAVTLFFGGNYLYNSKKPFTENEIVSLKIEDVNRFDRCATNNFSLSAEKTSDIMLITSLAIPAGLMIDKNMRRDIGPIGISYLQTAIITGAEIQLVKGLIDRARPFNYNSRAPMSEKLKPDARASFFSGHTAMTAAAASFTAVTYSIYYPDSKALPYLYITAAAIPVTTGYLRFKAGKHFPSDIAAGLIVGALNGFLIANWHKSE